MKPFVWFYLILLMFIAFEPRMPYLQQLNSFRQEIMSVFLLPFLIINTHASKALTLKMIRRTFIIAGGISLVYSVILLLLPKGYNPYLMALERVTDFEYKIGYAFDKVRSIGRVFSTFPTPQAWAYFLGYMFFFIFFFFEKNMLRMFFLLLTLFCIMFCGVRTVIAAVLGGFCAFLYLNGSLKQGFIYIIVLFVIGYIFWQIPQIQDYLLSFIGSKKSSMAGSNMDMRLVQLEGTIEEIETNPLFGNGFRWTQYYNQEFGNHPKAVTFESLIFVVLANWGILGCFVWIVFLYILYRANSKLHVSYSIPLNVVLAYYVAFSLITGEYCYIVQFAMFYSLFYISVKELNVVKFGQTFLVRK